MKKILYIVALIIPVVFCASFFITKARSAIEWVKFPSLDGEKKVAITPSIENRKKLIIEPNGYSLSQEAPIDAYKTFDSEYDMTWNMMSNNYKQFHLVGTKNGKQIGGYETRKGTTIFGITVGKNRSTVKEKYGDPLRALHKRGKSYVQTYIDKYGNEMSGTYLIDEHYVTFFYDAHKDNSIRSIAWVDAKTENTKPAFFATPTTQLRDSFENLMVVLINEARVAEGLTPLTYTPQYNSIARKHSTSMAQNNYFSHKDLKNQRGGQRMKNGGVSYAWWGENLAYGQYSAIYAHEALMNSLGHRKNILRKEFTHVFVGVDFNHLGQPYFTMNFFGK